MINIYGGLCLHCEFFVSRILMKREETFVGHCCPPVVEGGLTLSYKPLYTNV